MVSDMNNNWANRTIWTGDNLEIIRGMNSKMNQLRKRVVEAMLDGELELEVPRDRNGSFEPQVLRKGQRRMDGMDEGSVTLYTRVLSTRGI